MGFLDGIRIDPARSIGNQISKVKKAERKAKVKGRAIAGRAKRASAQGGAGFVTRFLKDSSKGRKQVIPRSRLPNNHESTRGAHLALSKRYK